MAEFRFSKGMVIHHLNDWNNLPVMERWFHREHCPDVMRQFPYIQSYHMYRVVNPPPEGAEKFCFMNYRVHETMNTVPGRTSMNGDSSGWEEPVENAMNVAMFWVPPQPDDDFWGKQHQVFEKPFIRWLCVFKYPEGVSRGEGDDWYVSVHVPELIQQCPSLLRYFSYKVEY